MITFFTIPKPFIGLAAIQQRNALESWKCLQTPCEVILCGNDPSVSDMASSLGFNNIEDIEVNEYGTPFLSSVFERVYEIARNEILCFINSDIILFDQFIDTIKRIKFNRYLAVGQRTDLDLSTPIDFASKQWQSDLLLLVKSNGILHKAYGMDYFAFTKNSKLQEIPPFLVGRPSWDNWFIYNALKRHVPVVDLTQACLVVHQNHDYSHIPLWEGKKWGGPEASYNIELYRELVGDLNVLSIKDSTHILQSEFVKLSFGRNTVRHFFQTRALLHPALRHLIPGWNKNWRL
jgi:hypothetical protein